MSQAEEDENQQRGKRQTQDMACGEEFESGITEDDDVAVGDELSHTPTCDHQDESGHNGLNAQACDEQGVDASGRQSGAESGQDDESQRSLAHQQLGTDGGTDGDDRANGKVHAAGGDDQSHAQGEEHNARALVENIDGRAVDMTIDERQRQEAGIENGVDHNDDQEPDGGPPHGRAG